MHNYLKTHVKSERKRKKYGEAGGKEKDERARGDEMEK